MLCYAVLHADAASRRERRAECLELAPHGGVRERHVAGDQLVVGGALRGCEGRGEVRR